MERSVEIKFLVEKELRVLEVPCSVSDMVKRVSASRMPVEKHLETLLASPDFADISMVRVGGVDVIYRKASAPPPQRQEKGVEEIGRTKSEEPERILG